MNRELMFSSVRQDWATPKSIFDELDKEFHFTLDPCCTEKTAKCKRFFTPKEDGLKQSWAGENVFVNPPFGREQAAWIKKGYEESLKPNTTVVFLIPSRTDTRSFHKYIYTHAELRFIKGRIKFENPDSITPKEKWTAAPFPSMIAILGMKQSKTSGDFVLSDKILFDRMLGIVLKEEDVKEFLRRLKDNINSKGSYYANPEIKKELKESIKRDWNDNWQEISLIIEQTCKFKEEEFFREIDKLAGEELTK